MYLKICLQIIVLLKTSIKKKLISKQKYNNKRCKNKRKQRCIRSKRFREGEVMNVHLSVYFCHRVIHFVVLKVNLNKAHIKYFFMIFLYFYCKVLMLTICLKHYFIHLKNHYVKCCKHWFFWGNFYQFFDAYWAVVQPIAPSYKRVR